MYNEFPFFFFKSRMSSVIPSHALSFRKHKMHFSDSEQQPLPSQPRDLQWKMNRFSALQA